MRELVRLELTFVVAVGDINPVGSHDMGVGVPSEGDEIGSVRTSIVQYMKTSSRLDL
jgi:hypothetical protein